MQQDGAIPPKTARHPLIVSYYTPGSAYEALASDLRKDASRLGLAARIEPRESRGSWVENCAQKAEFIRELHHQEQRPLLWLDADSRLRRPMRMLEGISADLGVARRAGWEFYTGQIYFGAGPAASRLLDIWCDYCVRFPQVWDQVLLGYAWWELSLQQRVDTLWFGERLYTKTAKNPLRRLWQRAFYRPAILQKQESRRSKAVQGEPSRPEFGMDDVPLWWREAAKREAPFPLDPAQRTALGIA